MFCEIVKDGDKSCFPTQSSFALIRAARLYNTARALTRGVATADPLAASLGISPVVQARAYV